MKFKKSTLALFGVFYTISVMGPCNSTSGHEKADTSQLTLVELQAYLARIHFPEDSSGFDGKIKANEPAFSHDWGVRAELTERSD